MLTGKSRHIDTPRRQGAEMAMRREVSMSWNLTYAQPWLRAVDADGQMKYYKNGATPFRAVMNNNDPLNRKHYRCAGGVFGKRKWFEACDGTNVPAISGNPKQYWQQADYVKFKKGVQFLIERNRDVYNGRANNYIKPS